MNSFVTKEMSDHVYDVIVVGAGVEGSATAYYLASRYTKNVLLLEQFSAGHTRGSSHGGSRITRRAYDQPYYVKMMNEAFQLWSEVEKLSQKELYKKTGIIAFGDSKIQMYIDSLSQNNIPHRIFTGKEANEIYSDQLCLPEDYVCVIEDDGGILRANAAVAALQNLFVKNGGHFLDKHKVTGIVPGHIITVETEKGVFKTTKLIVTAGAWANKVLKTTGLHLPLKVIRTEVLYWPVKNPRAFSSESFPVFFIDHIRFELFYGLPIEEYPGLLKVCTSHNCPVVDPDQRDVSPKSYTCDTVSQFIGEHFKGVSSKPAIMEVCMYTVTESSDPFLDFHPQFDNIVIGAGFSGHGFKLAPVIGKVLSELILGRPSSYDLTPFKINKPQSSL